MSLHHFEQLLDSRSQGAEPAHLAVAQAGTVAQGGVYGSRHDPESALGLEHETGRLEPGLAADLIVVADDPCRAPATLLRPLAVFARGREIAPLPFEER